MKAVIKVKDGFGNTQYYRGIDGTDEFVNNLQDAEVMSEFDAQRMLDCYKADGFLWPSIWKTATIVNVRIVEV